MPINLEREEQEVIRALHDSGLSSRSAILAVVMFTRRFGRPERELADIISHYPGLENGYETMQAIHTLKRRDWLVVCDSFGQQIVQAAPDLLQKIEQSIRDTNLTKGLQAVQSRLSFADHIRVLGPMTGGYVFGSYMDLLANAQREICLPMLATSPNLKAVPILQERARTGVHIRILLGAPEVTEKLRGGRIAKKSSEEVIEGWKQNARGIPHMEIRIAHHVEDMLFATSWTLDGRLLRFDIYDPYHQRSLDGIMIEVTSPHGLNPNLITLFQAWFDTAWNRAEPVHGPERFKWMLTGHGQWLAFGTVFAVACLFGLAAWGSTVSNVTASVAATLFINACVASRMAIRSALRKILSD